MADIPDWLAAAHAHWRWRGTERPSFAVSPQPGQVSVWDFPRPPVLSPEAREVTVRWGTRLIAKTCRAVRVLETSHPPSYYLPRADIEQGLLEAAGGGSLCEWKGPARYWSLVDGNLRLERIAWSYPSPLPGAEALADCVAFYARGLECTVGGQPVVPQAGPFYGGWITHELVGPFKGEPGSEGW